MPYANDATGDWEKLQVAWGEITKMFGSFQAVLEAFGLADMPPAQRYGILFGCCVFVGTISTVLVLLVWGGSFQRIQQQTLTGSTTLTTPVEARAQRALLLEQLLEGRERMRKQYPPEITVPLDQLTPLTKMLLNVAPDPLPGDPAAAVVVAPLIEDEHTSSSSNNNKNSSTTPSKAKTERFIPPHYQDNYVEAYRKCQDKPGGAILSGRPEARFEAYARGYAGCGPYTSTTYRRSYARIYESICCVNHQNDDKYGELFRTRPYDIIGKHVRLEALQSDRHLSDLFHLTSGEGTLDRTPYDPALVWAFQPEGPFTSPEDMAQSFVFVRKPREAGFAFYNSISEKLIGVILLTQDHPEHLSIQLEPPIQPPGSAGNVDELEACFLLFDRLFGYGYRRIQCCVDSQDADTRKLVSTRLGFTYEGCLCKHQIWKDSSRDSHVYSLLNSDWKQGARASLFRRLYGDAALAADTAQEAKATEYEEQQRVLAEQEQTLKKNQ